MPQKNKFTPKTQRLYHFSPSKYACSNIKLRRLKISRFSQINDPYELLAVNISDPNMHQFFPRMKDIIDQNNGLLCFSRSWSNPLLWGHYAEKHQGIALGFDVTTEHLVNVKYRKKPLSLKFNQEIKKPVLNDNIIKKLIGRKFKPWKYEKEVRIYVKLDHETPDEKEFYYYPFDNSIVLREVILGPKCNIPIKEIEKLTASCNSQIKVICTELSLDRFKIIQKRNINLE